MVQKMNMAVIRDSTRPCCVSSVCLWPFFLLLGRVWVVCWWQTGYWRTDCPQSHCLIGPALLWTHFP